MYYESPLHHHHHHQHRLAIWPTIREFWQYAEDNQMLVLRCWIREGQLALI